MTARQLAHHIDNCEPRAYKGERFIKVTKSGMPKIPHPEHSVLVLLIYGTSDRIMMRRRNHGTSSYVAML